MADFIEKQENLTKDTKTYELYSFLIGYHRGFI